MNRRGEIKLAVQTALLNETGAADKVYISRARQFSVEEFPAISITSPKETSKREGRNPDQYEQTCQIQIDIFSKLTDTYEVVLDTISQEVEDILLVLDPNNFLPDGAGNDIFLSDTDVDILGGEDRQPLAVAQLTFNFVYSAQPPQPSEEETATYDITNETEALDAA